eukprot:CAMPEP_0173444928 /NCGR_PEP_ID=MMETSP1357-20121228/33248_1 /TAXON_ID=77926 /ORGANISM="Hemiselmis rufescens, Strain PCC563" /LENGTH=47 /DNA_ID= /DNA_START= /DNA_END= /DNA_ORIENTATION=
MAPNLPSLTFSGSPYSTLTLSTNLPYISRAASGGMLLLKSRLLPLVR